MVLSPKRSRTGLLCCLLDMAMLLAGIISSAAAGERLAPTAGAAAGGLAAALEGLRTAIDVLAEGLWNCLATGEGEVLCMPASCLLAESAETLRHVAGAGAAAAAAAALLLRGLLLCHCPGSAAAAAAAAAVAELPDLLLTAARFLPAEEGWLTCSSSGDGNLLCGMLVADVFLLNMAVILVCFACWDGITEGTAVCGAVC